MAKAQIRYRVQSSYWVNPYELPSDIRNKWKRRWKLNDHSIAQIETEFGIYIEESGQPPVSPADVELSATEALKHCQWLTYWLENKDWLTADHIRKYDRPTDYSEDVLLEQLIDLSYVLKFVQTEASARKKGGSHGKGRHEKALACQLEKILSSAGKRTSKSESGVFWQTMSDLMLEAKDPRKPTTFVNAAITMKNQSPKKGPE